MPAESESLSPEESRPGIVVCRGGLEPVVADELRALAPEPATGFSFFRPAPSGPPTLNGVSASLMRAAMAMQSAEVAPTARQVAACAEAREQYREVMERWQALKERIGA